MAAVIVGIVANSVDAENLKSGKGEDTTPLVIGCDQLAVMIIFTASERDLSDAMFTNSAVI